MDDKKQKVLVYGATGAQARPLIPALQAKGHLPYAQNRNKSQAVHLSLSEQQLLEVSLEDKSGIYQATQGMDVVMLTIPFFAADEAGRYTIEAAHEAGVKLLIWNPSGAIPHETSQRHGLNVRMYNMEYLIASGLPYMVFQPTVYLENLLLPETAKGIATQNVIEYPAPSEAPMPWMAADDMARLMVAAMDRPDLVRTVFTVSGRPLNGHQLAECFSQALGRTITYRQISAGEYAQRLDRQLGEGNGKAIMGLAESSQPITVRKATFDPFPVVHATDKLNIPMMRITDWIKQYATHFS